jgi:hypothetical protein
VKRGRQKGAAAQRKALCEKDPVPAPALLQLAGRSPRVPGDIVALLSATAAALLEGAITKAEADQVLEICKFQYRLLEKDDGGDRATLLALAGISEEDAAGMTDAELAQRAKAAVGNPLAGPPS